MPIFHPGARAVVIGAWRATSKRALSVIVSAALFPGLYNGHLRAQSERDRACLVQAHVDGVLMLPIELLGLSGTVQGGSVALHWTSLTEHRNDYYVIERSGNAQNFLPLGTMEASGESLQRIDYAFLDASPLAGVNHYRLKQVYLDGAYEYTPAVVVLGSQAAAPPTVFPNPATDVVNIGFEMPLAGTAYVQVVDLNGRVVRDRDSEFDQGPQTLSIRAQDLVPGTYDLRLLTTVHGGLQNIHFVKE